MMNPLKKINKTQTQQFELTHFGLLIPILQPQILAKFKQSFRSIFGRLYWTIKNNDLQGNQWIQNKTKQVLTILKRHHTELTLSYLIKKMAYLFLFINQSCYHKMIDQKLAVYFQSQILNLKAQISQMTEHKKKKRSNSLTKVYDFIRSLSEDKQVDNKLSIQKLDDRVIVKQILKNCFEPYCNYLQKIIQDNQSYKSIVTKNISNHQQSIDWKIMNWATKLCDIIVEMNRLAKYFKNQLMGVWVFIAYIISLDLSVYFDTLINRIQKQSEKWVQKIKIIQKVLKISRRKIYDQAQSVLNHPKFIQLRRQIEQLDKIRQKMNFLYRNPKIQNWMKEFVFPRPFNPEKNNQINNEQCVKQFIYLCQKNENKGSNQNISPPKLSHRQIKQKRLKSQSSFQSYGFKNKQQEGDSPQKIISPKKNIITTNESVQPNLLVVNKIKDTEIPKHAIFALKRMSIMGKI